MYEGPVPLPRQHVLVSFFVRNVSHPCGDAVRSHCDFDLHSPNDSWCSASVHMFAAICMSSSEEQLFNPYHWVLRVIYSRRKSLIGYKICLPFGGLSFHFLGVLRSTKEYILKEPHGSIYSFVSVLLL